MIVFIEGIAKRNREASGSLEKQLPGREWAALAPEDF